MTRKAEQPIEDTTKDGGGGMGLPEFPESLKDIEDLAIEAKKLSDNNLISRAEAKERIIRERMARESQGFQEIRDMASETASGEVEEAMDKAKDGEFHDTNMETEKLKEQIRTSRNTIDTLTEENLNLKIFVTGLREENATLRGELSKLTGKNNSTHYQEFISNPQNKKEFDELVKSMGLKECPQDQQQAVINIIIQRRK